VGGERIIVSLSTVKNVGFVCVPPPRFTKKIRNSLGVQIAVIVTSAVLPAGMLKMFHEPA
jgi:hypothetical protein